MITERVSKILSTLLSDGESFVNLSIAPNPRTVTGYNNELISNEAWKECIAQSLDELLTSYTYTFNLYTFKDNKVNSFTAKIEGQQFIKYFWNKLKDADAIKVTISPQHERHNIYIVVRSL